MKVVCFVRVDCCTDIGPRHLYQTSLQAQLLRNSSLLNAQPCLRKSGFQVCNVEVFPNKESICSTTVSFRLTLLRGTLSLWPLLPYGRRLLRQAVRTRLSHPRNQETITSRCDRLHVAASLEIKRKSQASTRRRFTCHVLPDCVLLNWPANDEKCTSHKPSHVLLVHHLKIILMLPLDALSVKRQLRFILLAVLSRSRWSWTHKFIFYCCSVSVCPALIHNKFVCAFFLKLFKPTPRVAFAIKQKFSEIGIRRPGRYTGRTCWEKWRYTCTAL